jgi:hypothetical protein
VHDSAVIFINAGRFRQFESARELCRFERDETLLPSVFLSFFSDPGRKICFFKLLSTLLISGQSSLVEPLTDRLIALENHPLVCMRSLLYTCHGKLISQQ